MSYIRDISIGNFDRSKVIHFVQEKKAKGLYRVIDVGASMNSWSIGIVDSIVDINFTNGYEHIKKFNFDITYSENWRELEEDVEKNGKYDFSICTHTLEDIADPKLVIKKLVNISKAGYIATPSKYIELKRGVNGPYRGHIHHRWIFTFKDGEYIAYPKLNFLEHENFNNIYIPNSLDDKGDLSFFWENNLEIKYVNNNFLGPSVDAVIGYYKELDREDDCDKIIKNL